MSAAPALSAITTATLAAATNTAATITAQSSSSSNAGGASGSASLHILSKIFSQLATKHRFEQNIEELNDSFVHMEHKYPGSSESFIKHLLGMLKVHHSATSATTTTNQH